MSLVLLLLRIVSASLVVLEFFFNLHRPGYAEVNCALRVTIGLEEEHAIVAHGSTMYGH